MAWIVWGALVVSGFGQAFPDPQTAGGQAKPPDFGVRDEFGFFDRNSGALKRISDQILKLEADHGFRVFLLVEPALIATNASELAAELQQSWLPEGKGLVVVYESDNRSLGFGRNLESAPDDPEFAGRVPTHEAAAILQRAKEATAPNQAPEAYVEALMGNLVKEFEAYFERCDAPVPAGRALRLGMLIVGGLTLLALGAIGVGALVGLPSMAGHRSFRFPLVDLPERLGAPCGGGNVTTRRFRAR